MKCKVEGVRSDRLKTHLKAMPVDVEQLVFETTGAVAVGGGESELCALCGDKMYNDESTELGVCVCCRKGAQLNEDEGLFLVPIILFATNVRVGVLLKHRDDVETVAPLNHLRQVVESDGVVFLQFFNEEAPYDTDRDLSIRVLLDEQFQNKELADRLVNMRYLLPMPYAEKHLPEVLKSIRSGRGGQERALEQLQELEQLDPLFAGYDVLIARTLESLGNNDGAVKKLIALWERALLVEPRLFAVEYVRYDWHPTALRILPTMDVYVDRIKKRNRLLVESFEAL